MGHETSSIYNSSMEALKDLRLLGDTSLAPICDRLRNNIFEMKKQQEEVGLSKLGSMFKLIEKSIDSCIDDSLFNIREIRNIYTRKDYQNIDFERWDKILNVLPIFLTNLNLFSPTNFADLKINSNEITLFTNIKNDSSILESRGHVYALFRQLVSHKTLMTFELKDGKSPDESLLKLKLDISNDNNFHYAIDLSETVGFNLTFPSIISKYIISNEDAQELGKHTCLEISDTLELKQLDGDAEYQKRKLDDSAILYFPFLFRPVSIIIPKKGKIFPLRDIRQFGDTGSGVCNQRKHDVNGKGNTSFRHLDLFSLLNN